MSSLIMDLEFPPGSTFEDKSTRAGRIWFRTLKTIMQQPGCDNINHWGRWIDSRDKVQVIISSSSPPQSHSLRISKDVC